MFGKKDRKRSEEAKEAPIKKIVRYGSTALLILCTVICFAVVISTVLNGGEAGLFGYRLFYVVTGSMEPVIPEGALIVVRESDEYIVGDIITFYSKDDAIEGYPNTHEIIELVTEDGELKYRTKGKANNTPDDDLVEKKDIIGKVRFSANAAFLKNLLGFLNTPAGFFAIILIPILIIAVISMKDFIKAMKEEMHAAAERSVRAEIENEQNEQKENSDEDETKGGGTDC